MAILRPKVTVNIIPAFQTVENEEQKILFIGQQLASGTATDGQLYESIGNSNEQDTLFGPDSMLATMIRSAKAINKANRFDAIPLDDDGGSTGASGNVTFTGTTATEAGTITIIVGSEANNTYEVAVALGDDPTDVGDTFAALLAADTNALVDGVNVTGVVTLTAVNKGLEGNKISIKVTGEVAGITSAVTLMASGATNPTLTTLFDVIGNTRYQWIVWPSTYTLSTVTTFLDARFNVDNRILDGVAITSITDTLANLKTTGNAEDTQTLVILGNQTVSESLYTGSSILEMDYVIASQVAAIAALRLTEEAGISQYVTSSQGALDAIGGPALASKPYFNTPFANLPLIDNDNEFTDIEIDELNEAGICVLGNNSTKTKIIAADILTTYKTDSAGNADTTYKFLNYVNTVSEIREYFVNNLRNRFEQSRLTEGRLIPGRDMANANVISGYLNKLYNDLGGASYVLVPQSENARQFFINNKTVVLDLALGKATVTMIVPIVTQLREIIATMQVSFSTNS